MATGWWSRAGGLVVGFVLLAVIVVLDVGLGPSVVISGSYGGPQPPRGVLPARRARLALREGTLDEALERLLAHLTAHSQDRIRDDMALVLVEHRTA